MTDSAVVPLYYPYVEPLASARELEVDVTGHAWSWTIDPRMAAWRDPLALAHTGKS